MKNVLFATLFAAAPLLVFAQNNRLTGPGKPQAAHVDYFLKLDGIDGESTADKCKGCIDIESFSWGTTNPAAGAHGTGGGGGAGKVSVHDISVTKLADKSSADLMKAAATGQHIKTAKLFVRKQGTEQQDYLQYELENVLISNFSTSGHGSSSSDRPMESLSINFTKITYQWLDASGKPKNLGAGQTPQSVLERFLKK